MKRVLVVAAAVWAAFAPHPGLGAQTRATAANVPVIAHEAVPNFFKNPPGIYTGENMGIATSSKGNIYIYHRANETRLFEYSPQGEPDQRPGWRIEPLAIVHQKHQRLALGRALDNAHRELASLIGPRLGSHGGRRGGLG